MKANKNQLKKIALERINILFREADDIFNKNPELANRYIKLARKITMSVNLKIPSNLKRRFCKHCYCFLKPGKNCRVRTHKGKVVYYCFNCKKYMRFPYLKEKRKKYKSI